MNDPRQHRLWSIPGDGVLARQGGLIVLSAIDDRGLAESLLELLVRTAETGGDGQALADAVGTAVGSHQSWGGLQVPAVIAFGPAGNGLAFAVSGTAFVEIATAHGTHRLTAGLPSMLQRCLVGVPVQAVRGGLGGHGPGDRTDRFSRLDSGTVRAWGLSYYAGQPGAPAPASPATLPPQPAPASLVAPVDAPVFPPAQPAAASPASAIPPGPPARAPMPPGPPAPAPMPPGPPVPASSPPVAASGAPGPRDGGAAPAEPYRADPFAEQPGAFEPGEPAAFEPGEPAAFEPGEPAAFEPGEPAAFEPPPFEQGPPPRFAAGAPGPVREEPSPAPGSHELNPVAQAFEEHGLWEPDPSDQGLAGPASEPAPFELGIGEPGIEAPPPAAQTSLGSVTPQEMELPNGPEDTAAEDEESSGVPIVMGVRCKNGHFTDPDSRSCVVCGGAVSRRSATPERGPRPPLGVLILDDGASVDVDGDYVIGRDPSREPTVSAGDARPLRVVDAESTISRIHAGVHLDGWQVFLVDLGSANGTRIRPPGSKSEQLLEPKSPVQLQHGTQIFVGTLGLRYERRGR